MINKKIIMNNPRVVEKWQKLFSEDELSNFEAIKNLALRGKFHTGQ